MICQRPVVGIELQPIFFLKKRPSKSTACSICGTFFALDIEQGRGCLRYIIQETRNTDELDQLSENYCHERIGHKHRKSLCKMGMPFPLRNRRTYNLSMQNIYDDMNKRKRTEKDLHSFLVLSITYADSSPSTHTHFVLVLNKSTN